MNDNDNILTFPTMHSLDDILADLNASDISFALESLGASGWLVVLFDAKGENVMANKELETLTEAIMTIKDWVLLSYPKSDFAQNYRRAR